MKTNEYEPAFPLTYQATHNGMSKRFYAAIKLGVPDSGEEWLDEMIKKSNRRNAACAAMQGLLAQPNRDLRYDHIEEFIKDCYDHADELLKQENE